MAQLVRIGGTIEQRWGLKKNLQNDREKSENEEDRDEEEWSKSDSEES